RKAKIRLCSYMDEGHEQQLHAKALAIETASEVVLAFGSANFTRAGLFLDARHGNVELLLVVRGLRRADFDPATVFDPDGTSHFLTRAEDLRYASADDQEPR